jgi:hypothetical protein
VVDGVLCCDAEVRIGDYKLAPALFHHSTPGQLQCLNQRPAVLLRVPVQRGGQLSLAHVDSRGVSSPSDSASISGRLCC